MLLVLACFVASHLLVDRTGAWGAVAIVTAVATAAYIAILGGYSSSYSDSEAVWPPLPSQRRTSR